MTHESKVFEIDLADENPWGQLSSGIRSAFTEAAAVMLNLHHNPKISFSGTWIQNGASTSLSVVWSMPDQVARDSHGNAKDATEYGAYAIAIHAVTLLGWKVLGRLQQGSGGDWYAFDANEGKNMKIEVSGTSEGDAPKARLNQKIAQAKGGSNMQGWGGMAFVFHFQDVCALSEVW